MLIGALAVGACGAELDADGVTQTAAKYVALYNDWDGAEMASLHAKRPDMPKLEASLGWLRGQLGRCDAPVLMWRQDLTRGRFRAPCERGELELFLQLDREGRVVRTIRWAVGVPTPEVVERAANTVVAAMPWQRDGAGKQPWGKPLRATWVRQLGRCEIAGVRSVSASAGRFDLRCEHGNALMKVWVKGQSVGVALWPSNVDKTRAWERELMG